MKKGVVIALACLLLFSACGQQTEKPENSEKPQETVGPIMQEEKVSSLYDSPNNGSEDVGAKNSESNEERLVRIVRNVCADLYHTTQEGGLQIRQPEYQGNECHIYTYTPGNTGPTLFVEFIFDVGGNAETAIADFWGERTVFRLSDYDTHTKAPAPTQPSQYPSDIIFNWYSELELEYADQLEAEGYGDAAASYWLNGELAKADIFVVTDVFDVIPSGYTSTYYYHGTTPYLAHIVGYGKEENLDVILYFWDRKIIHWIGKDGIEHDGTNAEYEEYYEKALEEYQNIMKAHAGGSGVPLYKSSTIGRFQSALGCSFSLPDGFVIKTNARILDGCKYTYSFYHAGLNMTVEYYESNTTFYEKSGTEMLNDEYNFYYAYYSAGDDSITYFPRGDNWFVVSGYSQDGAEVFYKRVYGNGNFYYYYLITYPTANKSICDQMVGDFAKSFYIE